MNQSGDTIIEVLFAITVFSLVAISGLSLMNQGAGIAQRSLEIGLVREQMDSQADALQFLNHAYVADYGKNGPATAQWKLITDQRVTGTGASEFEKTSDGTSCIVPGPSYKPFALDVTKLDSNPILATPGTDTATYAKISYYTSSLTDKGVLVRTPESQPKAEGIWIEAVRSPDDPPGGSKLLPGYYDFHIRACWISPGQSHPVTLGTIVRLYEPRS